MQQRAWDLFRHCHVQIWEFCDARARIILGPCACRQTYINPRATSRFFTTLAFWLRSSVVSVLNSLTTIMRAPPSFFGYQIFAALVPPRALLATPGV